VPKISDGGNYNEDKKMSQKVKTNPKFIGTNCTGCTRVIVLLKKD